eukprot:gene10875-7734_t
MLLQEQIDANGPKSNIIAVEAAHMEMAEPSIAQAYGKCVSRGAEHVVVHPFFLSQGRHVQDDIPQLVQEAAHLFLSPPTRAKIAKSYDVVAPDDRMRFHLRLRDQARVSDAPRHVITRITRYFPDISYDFAKQIVARAREEGAALVRVFSSLSDAEEAVELFRRADPPIHCEIFDAKTEELVST